jgi:anti-anti-sigma regulatory factor
MKAIAIVPRVDEGNALEILEEVGSKLATADGELTIDFSSVRRVDSRVIGRLEELADQVDGKSVRVVVRGANVDLYKVFKLVKLSSRIAFNE